jgi:hypothetical protein
MGRNKVECEYAGRGLAPAFGETFHFILGARRGYVFVAAGSVDAAPGREIAQAGE